MYRHLIPAISLLFTVVASAQLNIDLVSNLDYEQTVNDIWGYTAADTTEYALVGTNTGLSIVTLADPAIPEEVAFIPGENTVWRDIKTHENFAYVVSDNTTEGILIVDLQYLPDSVDYNYFSEPLGGIDTIRRSHNIYIDEFGLAYLAGSNLGSIVILDLKEDPWNPTFLAQTPAPYAHDVYVRDSVVYASEIFAGRLAMYDITNLDTISFLGSTLTPREFTHNAWLSDDGKTVFTTDERANAWIGSYDISDLSNIRELDRYRPAKTVGEGVIPHNVHVLNDYLVISYYTDGCIIVDASRPDNLIEVGSYDTYPGPSGGFSGSWGAYPYLPSGLTLISDRQTGLYVVRPDYKRGCFLEGRIFSEVPGPDSDQVPLLNAEITIVDPDEELTSEFSNIDGTYKTGKAIAGNYMVRVAHPEHITQEVMASFDNGVITELDIVLVPRQRFALSGTVISEVDDTPVEGANVVLTNGEFTYETVSDADGSYLLPDVFEGSYRVFAGVWGEFTIDEIDLSDNVESELVLSRGYYDDFNFDFGWTVDTANEEAVWVRDIPVPQLLFGIFECNPSEDLPDDFGAYAYVTGNMGNVPGENDVDNGTTTLITPPMDLTFMTDPVVSYRPWLCVRFTEIEAYFVLASNGIDTVVIDTVLVEDFEGYWREPVEVHLKDNIDITEEMKVHFVARDDFGDGNVVKAALDRFEVFDAVTSSSEDLVVSGDTDIYPNPTSDDIHIRVSEHTLLPDKVRIYDMLGRMIFTEQWDEGRKIHTISPDWETGMYLVQTLNGGRILSASKVLVQR